MNVLPTEKKIAAIAALTEGVSIRATERLTGIHRDTIMRLGAKIGAGCAALHDALFRNLHVATIELDEIWAFVAKEQGHRKDTDPPEYGDQYSFIALDATNKAIVSYLTGKRTSENTIAFASDLRERIVNRPHISSDAFAAYREAIDIAFAQELDYGQIHKTYVGDMGPAAARRYSPGRVVDVEVKHIFGRPGHVSTSLVERQNLTLRMQQRRFTRLTSGFSKKLANHEAAVSLYVAHYNLCRVHEAIRMTPAMTLGVTDHIWTIAELIEAAETGAVETTGKRVGRFTVIDGGLS